MSHHDTTLGKLATESDSRDAIHIAVIAITTEIRLTPGQHIGVSSNRKASLTEPAVGVVDPFLKEAVQAGERFFLCLYPKSITSLRHLWEHPMFPIEKLGAPAPITTVADSEQWLREYAVRLKPYEVNDPYTDKPIENGPEKAYQTMMAELRDGDIFAWGSDLHGLAELRDAEEFFRHASNVLGRHIDPSALRYSCSC